MPDLENNGMDHGCSDMPSMAVTFPGPFEHHDVVVNGWRVRCYRHTRKAKTRCCWCSTSALSSRPAKLSA